MVSTKKMRNVRPIQFTTRALERIKSMTTLEKPSILIGVNSGGCNGLKYFITPVSQTSEKDVRVDLKDSKDSKDVNIAVCGKSLVYLFGTLVSWKVDDMGSRFEFENPNASSRCGCGSTFDVS